ncbi:uncharacterized protein B0I36DRAFT_368060 [Microdochium trichocladiopsis]|uniref:Rhodopsin domain-containing protein n=1 Tax=Microdochium trichocladiopsis TaxID=1682393 RepID=A0A9P8XVC0_9PEZI|nr:uncharacterized protein B0I36DRAFT_368060 [Microdochium trichocladiopsis]KAH7018006.1 hypothetical protein B0I36DRAFT_368060 [Microdochium trichocladiopsis]
MENRGPTLLILNAVFMGLMLLTMILRMWVRLGIVKSWGWDDSLMAAAVLFYGIYLSFSIHGVMYGTGRHFKDVPLEDYEIAMKSWWICYPFYSSVMIASKLSIGYFLLRVTVRRLHLWLLYITMAVTLCAGLAFFVGSFLQCRPISYWWTRYGDPAGGFCIDPTIIIVLAYMYSVFAITSDLMMALFPALLISALNMNRQLKILLIPLMAMGTIASLGLVVRLPWLLKLRDTEDFLWSTIDIAIWSTVEGGLAIVAGNLATLRPLYRYLMQEFGFTRGSAQSGPLDGSGGSAGQAAYKARSTTDSKKSRSNHRRGGGTHGSNGSFSLGIATVFGGTAGVYPLSDIDDGEYGGTGRGSDDDQKNNNKNNEDGRRSKGTNQGKGFPNNSGHVGAQYERSDSFSRANNNNHNTTMAKEGITARTSIFTTSSPANAPLSGGGVYGQDDHDGIYHDGGRPYGLRTQIVAENSASGRGKTRTSSSDDDPNARSNKTTHHHHRLPSSDSQEALYPHTLTTRQQGSGADGVQTARGTRNTAGDRRY